MYRNVSDINSKLRKAIDYLASQYNPAIGLCREAPNVAPNTYWLVSDNLWAYYALKEYHPAVSDMIRLKLQHFAILCDLPRNRDGLPISYAHEAVIGDSVPIPFHTCSAYTLKSNGYVIKTDIANGTGVMLDWQEYADPLLYASLSYHYQGNDTAALDCFTKAKDMWDGKGIWDVVTRAHREYVTYKLALLLYVSKRLNIKLPFEDELMERIWKQQDPSTGGIRTEYLLDGTVKGDTNTETTSIVIIALTPPTTHVKPKVNDVSLPHTFCHAWWDQALTDWWLNRAYDYGFQGIASIVGATEWVDIERKNGTFDFSLLHQCMKNIARHGFWVMPRLVLNDPPQWFINAFPESILKDATNQTFTDYNWGGHVLSPWFVMSGEGDYYIKRFVDKYLENLANYSNVIGVWVGDHLVFNLPWYLGDSPLLTYFMCFDKYALESYRENFAKYPYQKPPSTYDELVGRGSQFMKDFEQWYRESAAQAIEKYLTWIGDRVKYKVINVGRIGSEAANHMIGTTEYQVKRVFNVMSQFNNTIEDFEALQDKDRVIEMSNWSTQRGIIFGGEPAAGHPIPAEEAVGNLIMVGGKVYFHIDTTFGELNQSMIDNIREFNSLFPPVPPYVDVAVDNVMPYRTITGHNSTTKIDVTISNLGGPTGRFNVTLYANETIIQTQETSVTSGYSKTLTFEWNTTIPLGNYTLKAEASQVENETILTNNEFYCIIQVSIVGDINADGKVNIVDLTTAARAFGSKPGEDRFEPNADVNEDGIINIIDIATVARDFGKTI
jgi:tetratricopeptide (TPR) repeat protein